MRDSTSDSHTTEDSIASPEKHGAKTKKHSPPGRGSTSATPHSGGKKQKAAGEQREMHSNATKPSKRSSSSKASLSKASSRADLIASKSQKTYDAQKGSSASTPNRAASFFKAIDPSPQGHSNLHTPDKLAKDPLRRKSRAQSRESPKDATPGNISVKPTWKGAETAARETDHGAGKRRGPSSVERSGVSRASSKRASPAKEEDKGSPATADKRSLRSKASRTSRHSPSSSSKRSMHSLRKHGGRCGDLPGERDFSVASVIPLVGGSRKSAGSSKRSLRPLEEGSVEEKEERKKHGEEKLLVMPDGTRVSVAEKNLWIRAMEKEHLGCDWRNWSCKFVIGIVMISIVYFVIMRQVRDLLTAPDNLRKQENDGTNYTTTTASSSHNGTFSPPTTPAASLSGRNQRNSTAKHELGMPL